MSSQETADREWNAAIAEVEGQMPKVRDIVTQILHDGKRLVKLSGSTSSDYARNSEVELRLKDMRGLLEEIEQIGCKFQQWNFQVATVDFPARIADQECCVCWRSDDLQPAFYHQAGEACSQRRPIPGSNPGSDTEA